MNAVTGRAGEGMAVLLRAAEPLEGLDEMRRRRARTKALASSAPGPAKLCQAFGVDRSIDGADLVRGTDVWISEGTPVATSLVVAGPRVGIRVGLEHAVALLGARTIPYVSRERGGRVA